MKGQYSFRKITSKQALKHFMQLRYQSYQNSALNCILKENKQQIDISIHDLHAEHFGLYCNDQPAGYLRFVFPRNEKYDSKAFEIGKELAFFNEVTHSKSALQSNQYPEFPFLNYPDITHQMQDYYASLQKKQECIIEPSRMTIFEEFKGIRAFMFLFECAIVLYMIQCTRKSHALVCCHRKYASFYQRYGLQKIEGSARSIKINNTTIPDYQYESLELIYNPVKSIEQSLQNSEIPVKYQPTFNAMYQEYLNHHQIARNL